MVMPIGREEWSASIVGTLTISEQECFSDKPEEQECFSHKPEEQECFSHKPEEQECFSHKPEEQECFSDKPEELLAPQRPQLNSIVMVRYLRYRTYLPMHQSCTVPVPTYIVKSTNYPRIFFSVQSWCLPSLLILKVRLRLLKY